MKHPMKKTTFAAPIALATFAALANHAPPGAGPSISMKAPMQDLVVDLAADGAFVRSVEEGGKAGFTITPVEISQGGCDHAVPEGVVRGTEELAVIDRGLLKEEFRTGTDGIRQDFIVTRPTACAGDLTLTLAAKGATFKPITGETTAVRVEMADGRLLDYSKLHVTDATGRVLKASLAAHDDLATISVDAAGATFPIRIDPTFSDSDWTAIARPDFNGEIRAIASGGGNLFVGGTFTLASGGPANRVARWDGAAWSPLGTGINGAVNALAYDPTSNILYIGGSFTNAGGVAVSNLARWNGTQYLAMSVGANGEVKTIYRTTTGNRIYVGGNFTTAGGVATGSIAQWTGSTFNALGGGVAGAVNAIAYDSAGDRVFVTGDFSSNSRVMVYQSSAWQDLGVTSSGSGKALVYDQARGRLYVGGQFNTASGVTVNGLASWTGTSWTALGAGLGVGSVVTGLDVDPSTGRLFIVGAFTQVGGAAASNAAQWSGTSLTPMSSGILGSVSAVHWDAAGSRAIAVGNFAGVAGGYANKIAAWNNTSWTNLSGGTSGRVNSVAFDRNNGRLFAGGEFNTIGGASAENVGVWNGSSWGAVGDGTSGEVNAVAYDHQTNTLYVGGLFVRAGANSAFMAARWTSGNNWSSIGASGPDNAVRAIAIDEARGIVYFGGDFSKVDALNVSQVARWNGEWREMAGGVGGVVRSLAVDPATGRVFVGGAFGTAGVVPAEGVASFMSEAWSALGAGVNDGARALFWDPANNRLYVGGAFSTAGGIPARGLARWQSGSWAAVGSGVNDYVRGIAVNPTTQDIYIVGEFTEAGGAAASRVAVIKNGVYEAIGQGANGPLTGITIDPAGQRLFVSGDVTSIGGKPAVIASLAVSSSAKPVLGGVAGSIAFDEGASPTVIAPTITVADTDSSTLASAAVSISAGYSSGQDLLSFTLNPATMGNIAASWDAPTGTLTLTSAGASATLAQWQAALRAVVYANNSDAPTTTQRTVRIVVSDGLLSSDAVTRAINVSAVNDAPTVSAPSVLNVIEDIASPITGITLSDVDAGASDVVFAISVTEGRIEATSGGGVTVYGSQVDATFGGSVANLNAFIASGAIRYRSALNRTGDRPIYMSVNDLGNSGSGGSQSQFIERVLRIANSNDVPTFNDQPSLSGTARVEGVLTVVGAEAIDPDGDTLTYSYRWFRNGGLIGGQSSSSYVVQTADAGAVISAEVSVSDGAGSAVATTPGVTVAQIATIALRADRITLQTGSGPMFLNVLANDVFTPSEIATGTLALAAQPAKGSATIDTNGTAANPADDRIAYVPNQGARGTDTLRYRLCAHGGTDCREASVVVIFRPTAETPFVIKASSDRGYKDIDATTKIAMPSYQATATGYAEGVIAESTIAPDATTESPWDNGKQGTATTLRTLPAIAQDGSARTWTIIVDAESNTGGDVDLYVGLDSNANGQADLEEVACTAAMSSILERCELTIAQAVGTTPVYWVMAHNRNSTSQNATRYIFEILPGEPTSLALTAPGILAANDGYTARVTWNAPMLVRGQSGMWIVNVKADSSDSVGVIPVRVDRIEGEVTPFALDDGFDTRVRVSAASTHRGLFIDVPAGATRLTFTSESAGNVQLYAARTDAPGQISSIPLVPLSPEYTSATHSSLNDNGRQTIVINNPDPGRWYAIPRNLSGVPEDVIVRATITGDAPTVRPGGYFNPGRSGTGLFLYPSGSVLAGILYTYLQDGTPTWYYLQGLQPTANGIWRAPIYRSTWNGARNTLVVIGEATVTPVAANRFTFTYTLDGQTGAEQFTDFGGGCPASDGQALNVSGHWFDVNRAGSGYSVQMFPNYEFFTVFGYDGKGVARYLSAERNSFGGPTATLDLTQVNGACPLCERTGNPTRRVIGTFRRTFTSGTISNITLSGTYEAGVSGSWSANDSPIPLGGLQGCQ